ncbi:hypothetical protein HPB48_007151 [Haemaphysalis longicornis]|uniref:BZIP domain-containing protein n=1 Tax=Haemaphysalis longicornis TaxID=44386 RepID=A0A9J6GK93_HAELO|nr:hypothetical protein HPB48_007151 [Haemaphysalis longicornis]
MMSFGTTVTVARAAQSSPPLPSREDALRLDGQVTGILPNLLRGSPPALAPLTAAMTAFEVTPPLVRPSPHQPAFPTSAEPSSSGGGSTPSTKYVRPFQAYSSKAYTLAAACGLPKKAAFSPSHLVGQQLLSQHLDPDYLAFREQFIQSVNMRNGHDVSHRRQRTHARDLAPAVSPPVPPSSPPENGSNAGSPDSGDDGEQTSPENSNSSCSAGVNGGSRGGGPIRNGASSSSARRRSRLPDEVKDAAYWERRRKNNEAAKRSRDARRAKEDEIAMRAAYLEGENYKLRCQVASLRHQIIAMQNGLYPAV